jgi:hypothetical protein
VRNLLASAIQAGAQIEFGRQIDQTEARTLADAHTLSSAMQAIRKKLRLHSETDPDYQFKLAIAETTLETAHGDNTEHTTDAIVEIRRQTFTQASRAKEDETSWSTSQQSLVALRDDILAWSSDFRRFLRGFNQLYRRRAEDLRALRLKGDVHQQAEHELAELFASYMTRAMGL